MFRRHPRLPVDLIFPTARWDLITKDVDKYVAASYDWLRQAIVYARATTAKEAKRQKRFFDIKAGAVELRPVTRSY